MRFTRAIKVRLLILALLSALLVALELTATATPAYARPCRQACELLEPPWDQTCWSSCIWCSGPGTCFPQCTGGQVCCYGICSWESQCEFSP